MSFPPGDTVRAFEHFLHAQGFSRRLCEAHPDLAEPIVFDELRLMVRVLLPDNRCVFYTWVEHRGVVDWAVITPGSAKDGTIEELFAIGTHDEIVAEILAEYDRLVAAGPRALQPSARAQRLLVQ